MNINLVDVKFLTKLYPLIFVKLKTTKKIFFDIEKLICVDRQTTNVKNNFTQA